MTANSMWPEGSQCAVTVTVNFDGESVEARSMPPARLWGRYAYGRYGAQIGMHRLLDLFKRRGVRATVFVPGWDAERYPETMAAIAEGGHEIAGRGYLYEDFSTLSTDEQQATLAKSEATLQRVFGRKPTGWRAPEGLMSAETRGLLAARGYTYDSSFGDDDFPYVVAQGGARLAELPVFNTAEDRFYYGVRRMPSHAQRALTEDFEAMYSVGGLFNLVLHPRGDYGSGRSVRIEAVEAVLQRIQEHPRVWLATCAEVAERVLAAGGEARPA